MVVLSRGQSAEVLSLLLLSQIAVWNHRSREEKGWVVSLDYIKLVPSGHGLFCSFSYFVIILFIFALKVKVTYPSLGYFHVLYIYHNPYILPCWTLIMTTRKYHKCLVICHIDSEYMSSSLQRDLCFSSFFLCDWSLWWYDMSLCYWGEWLCCDVISVDAHGSC